MSTMPIARQQAGPSAPETNESPPVPEPRSPRRVELRPVRRVGTALTWAIIGADIFIFLFIIFSSFKTTREIFAAPWKPPTHLHFENWASAWNGSGFGRAILNTACLVLVACVSIVTISAPAAYVLARTQSRLSGFFTVFFTVGVGIPAQVIVIPLFIMMARANLTNSLTGLYLVYTAVSLPFTVFLLTGFFRSLPEELEEAATLDGASAFRTFWQVMLPLARSGLITALILNAVGLWNETLIALVFIHDTSKYTLSLALLAFLAKIQYSGADYGALFAGIAIVVLPMVAAYVWLGRRIIEGMTLGAGK